MCERKSMLIVKGIAKPIWSLYTDSHEELKKLAKIKLNEDQFLRNFVAVEVTPRGDPFSTNPSDWLFKLDELASAPGWFEEIKSETEDRCIELLVKTIIPKELKTGQVANLKINGELSLTWLKYVGGYL